MRANVSPLFDDSALAALEQQFRSSIRRLLFDLCDELDKLYRRPVRALRVPVGFFRAVGHALKPESFAGWKVVGWIEELNDLVYFLDLQVQLRREEDPRGFAEQFQAECAEKFYEHSYQDELFPSGEPDAAGLARRLDDVCVRLVRQVTQEALFLEPGLPCAWAARMGRMAWVVPYDVGPNFERAELPGTISIGLEGDYLEPRAPLRGLLGRPSCRVDLVIRPGGLALRINHRLFPILTGGVLAAREWVHHPSCLVGPGGPTLGPVLRYGRDREPRHVVPAPRGLAKRVAGALAVIESAWPEGARLLTVLTTRIVPLKARGVVSFSYRHRPGLSFINCFDRDNLDLIDDLIHENSHHHLNLLLRKAVLYHKDRNQEIFYSPWRRSLRPLRGILHATFTFTMGAILFERLSTWAKGDNSTLTEKQILRARFRCLEEVDSVRYSLEDLEHARNLGWLTPAGWELVSSLKREIDKVETRIAPYEWAVMRSKHGRELRRQRKKLASARETYGPMRSGKI